MYLLPLIASGSHWFSGHDPGQILAFKHETGKCVAATNSPDIDPYQASSAPTDLIRPLPELA
jgi:hypothetical protein